MAKRKIKFALSCTSAILLIAVQITFGTLCFYFGESRIAPIERCCWSTVDTRERESIGGFGTEAIHECGFDRLEVPDLGIGGKSSVIIVALRRRKTLCQTNVRECALHPPPHFKVNRQSRSINGWPSDLSLCVPIRTKAEKTASLASKVCVDRPDFFHGIL